MTYLSNIDLRYQGDKSVLLTRLVDRTKPVLSAFFKWIGIGGTSFLLEVRRIKGDRTLARNGGKRTLPQMKTPI